LNYLFFAFFFHVAKKFDIKIPGAAKIKAFHRDMVKNIEPASVVSLPPESSNVTEGAKVQESAPTAPKTKKRKTKE
jgi:hypothetical protein